MSRLTLAELKAQNPQKVSENLEAIKGGAASGCHVERGRLQRAIAWYLDLFHSTW